MVTVCRKLSVRFKHDYDIVEGPMADDTIWDYVENYMAERISKRLSGNWLSLSIRHIRLYSVQRKHYRLSNLKGVIRYDKQIFPGRANNRECYWVWHSNICDYNFRERKTKET